MRKVVQVAATEAKTVALCDDGSIWAIGAKGNSWKRLPDVPRDDEQESAAPPVAAAKVRGRRMVSEGVW